MTEAQDERRRGIDDALADAAGAQRGEQSRRDLIAEIAAAVG